MTIYIEYVLLDNFVIDLLLIKATLGLTGKTVKKGWLFCCAFFSACLALIAPILSHLRLASLLYKLCSAFLIVLIIRKYKSFRDYYKTFLVFFALTAFTGGFVFAIFYLLNIPYSTDIAISLMVLPVYLGIKFTLSLVRFLSRKASERSLLCECEITLKGKTIKGKGFMDTGNGVYDGDSPVIFIDKRLASEFLTLGKINMKSICVSTVAGKTTKICITADKLKIYYKTGVNTYYNVTVAVTDLKSEEYSIILHPDFEEVKNAV